MFREIIKRLALRYTELDYPVDIKQPTLSSLYYYLELRELITGKDYRDEGYIEVSEDFYDWYDFITFTPPYDERGVGYTKLFYRHIPLVTSSKEDNEKDSNNNVIPSSNVV